MVSCATAGAGDGLQHGQIGQCLYGECMGMLGSYRGDCLTTDQGTSAGCSLFRVAAGDERWRGRQLDQLDQLEHRGGGFVPSFLFVLGDLDHGNQSTVGTTFIKSLLTLLCCTNIVMLN